MHLHYNLIVVGEYLPEVIVSSLEWDETNEDHLLDHHVTIAQVEEVRRNRPKIYRNVARPDRSGTHVMLGPDLAGRFFYIVLVPTKIDGRWRPVTAYRYRTARAQRIYDSEDDTDDRIR